MADNSTLLEVCNLNADDIFFCALLILQFPVYLIPAPIFCSLEVVPSSPNDLPLGLHRRADADVSRVTTWLNLH